MYAYKDRLKAIKLYYKFESYAAAINELGYPSRGALRHWVEEYKGHGDVKKEITRRPKYTDKEKRKAVNHYLEFGKCYSRTCKMLGYPSRALLTQWAKELVPQPRKFKRNGLKLTSEEKEAAVLAFLPVVIHLHRMLLMKLVLVGNPFINIKISCLARECL